jgi:hypothetical protein
MPSIGILLSSMEHGINYEPEMREIFRELNPKNQANLFNHARKFHVIHKEKKNEKANFSDGNTGNGAGIWNDGYRL